MSCATSCSLDRSIFILQAYKGTIGSLQRYFFDDRSWQGGGFIVFLSHNKADIYYIQDEEFRSNVRYQTWTYPTMFDRITLRGAE